MFSRSRMGKMIRLAMQAFACGLIVMICSPVGAQDVMSSEDYMDMELDELLNLEVSVASKRAESQFEASSIVSAVSREEFVVYGDRDLFQLMQRQPSVYTRNSYVYGRQKVGFRGDMSVHSEVHTLLLWNGRPIRESSECIVTPLYMAFPLAGLDSIEMIRGPGSVLYGTNAFTGVINLQSRAIPEEPEFSVSAMTGSHEYYETTFSAGGRSGALGFVADLRASGEQGETYRMIDALGEPGKDNRHQRSVSGAAHLDFKGFTLDVFGADTNQFAMGVQPFWFIPEQEINTTRLFANAGYRAPLHEWVTLELNATYNLMEHDMASPEITRIGDNTSDILGEVTLYADPIDDLNVVLGYTHEYRSNYHTDDHFYQSIPSYNYQPKSAYVEGNYKVCESLKLTAGGKWHEPTLGDSDVISRFGAVFTPFENWGLKLLRGEAFRGAIAIESDLDDPPILVGNDDLEPETVTTYDAQVFYHDKKTYAALTYFHSKIEDQIVFDATTSDPMTYKNAGEQEFDGIEFEAKYFFTPQWHALGSFMYQEDDRDDDVNHTVVPENMAKLGTAYTWKGGTASVFYTYFGTPPRIASPVMVNPTPEKLNLVSLNLRFDVSKWLRLDKGQSILSLRAENLLDEEVYVPTMVYAGVPNTFPYGPGATFYAGLKVDF